MFGKIEVPEPVAKSSTRREFVQFESIPTCEPDPVKLVPVGMVIRGSQLAMRPS